MAAAPSPIDVAIEHRAAVAGKLDRVGMSEIELPVLCDPRRDRERSRRSSTSHHEDTARRIHHLLESDARLLGHAVVVEHQESLHAHNAVSRVSGGTIRSSR